MKTLKNDVFCEIIMSY